MTAVPEELAIFGIRDLTRRELERVDPHPMDGTLVLGAVVGAHREPAGVDAHGIWCRGNHDAGVARARRIRITRNGLSAVAARNRNGGKRRSEKAVFAIGPRSRPYQCRRAW